MIIKNLIIDGNGIIYKKRKGITKGKNKWVLKEGAKIALKKLSQKYNLFILTDGQTKRRIKESFLKDNEVLRLFEDVTCTYELETNKKEGPKAFIKAMKQWGIEEETTIFIGHNKKELKNAALAGLKTIKTNDLRNLETQG